MYHICLVLFDLPRLHVLPLHVLFIPGPSNFSPAIWGTLTDWLSYIFLKVASMGCFPHLKKSYKKNFKIIYFVI